MPATPDQSKPQFYWGLFIVVSLTPLAFLLLRIVFERLPEFPDIPSWLSGSYLALQVLNRLNIGQRWVNDWTHNTNRLFFVLGAVLFALSILDRNAVSKLVWLISTCVLSVWLLFRVLWAANEGKSKYPLKNRAIGAIAGTVVDLPILAVCALAARNAL